MRNKISLFLLAFCLLLTGCAPAAQPESEPEPAPAPAAEALSTEEIPDPEEPAEPELSERDRNWISDIHYLQYNYKLCHPDPFYFCSEEEFDWKIDQLCKKVSGLSDNDLVYELTAIIAGMQDIHTMVYATEPLYEYLFPVGVRYFDGRMYLWYYLEGYEQFEPYLMREIVAVNGVDISYLEEKAESVISPNNAWLSKEWFSTSYFIPTFFDWAGCGYQEGYTFQILDENQKVQSVEVPLVPYEEYDAASAVLPEIWSALSDVEAGNRTEYREGKNGGYVYMLLYQMDSLREGLYRELFEKAAELLEAHPDCGKLVIDLRSNPGGRVKVLEYLREDIQILKALSIDQAYVLIGGYTTSAATDCISLFKEELNAVTVGEPTGQFTSFFYFKANVNSIQLTLPLSRLTVAVSTGWYEGSDPAWTAYDEDDKLYEWENTILPDVYVHMDIEDIRQGKNSILEWVLAQ